MKICYTFIFLILLSLFPFAYSDNTNTEINHLFDYIRSSNVEFVRNKKSYSNIDAIQHIKKKEKHFYKKIKIAEDFIRRCATKSLMSGRYYYIKEINPIDSTILKTKCSIWLLNELHKYRQSKVIKK